MTTQPWHSKTAALLLNRRCCHARLKSHSTRAGARAVVLAPSRELALQTHKVIKDLGRHTDLRTAVLVGGDSMEAQVRLGSSPLESLRLIATISISASDCTRATASFALRNFLG